MSNINRFLISYLNVENLFGGRQQTSKALSDKLIHAAKAYDQDPDELVYFTLASSRHFAVLLVNKKTGVIIGPVNADPE